MVFRALLVSTLFALRAHAAELDGVVLEDRVRVDGRELELNGIGMRTRFLFNVYVGGFYLEKKVSTAQAAIDAEGAKRVIFVMMRAADAEQFVESIDEGLRANNSPEALARVQPQIEALFAMIRNLGQAKKGMRIMLDYAASARATTLVVNGVAQGQPMAGEEYYRILLRIWFGHYPAQEELKRALLGQQL
jgi:long-chain acyl-CoA synthetase